MKRKWNGNQFKFNIIYVIRQVINPGYIEKQGKDQYFFFKFLLFYLICLKIFLLWISWLWRWNYIIAGISNQKLSLSFHTLLFLFILLRTLVFNEGISGLIVHYSLSMPPLFKASVALLKRKESINLCLPYLTPWLPCYNDVERFSWGSKKILQWNIIIWNFPLLRGKLLLVYSTYHHWPFEVLPV